MRYKDLLNANDILDLLTKKLNLDAKPMGKSVFFLCPFHDDSKPSLSFEPNEKFFNCFSCEFRSKDIFDFWSRYKKIGREKSIEEISKMGYFPSSFVREKKKKEKKEKEKFSFSLPLIRDIYQHNLFTRDGGESLDYLIKTRDINTNIINNFSLGCSINGRQISAILFEQENNKFSRDELITSNLVKITDDRKTKDFFHRKQIIFPLENKDGIVVAFASRKIISNGDNNENKYLYLPTYQNYNKSSLLYNYKVVKDSRENYFYLVEGFFDVISLSKIGVNNCLSILGTNISEEQIKLLSDLNKRVVLFLDGDRAGKEATISISVKLLLRKIDCEIVKNESKSDPDDICRRGGGVDIHELLRKRESPYSFATNYYFEKLEVKNNPQRISFFIIEIAKIFRKFGDEIRDFLVEKIKSLVKLNRNEIESYFVQWNFPAFDNFFVQYSHCKEIVEREERKMLELISFNRNSWLKLIGYDYFFADERNRDEYRCIFNHYMSSSLNKKYLPKEKKEFYKDENVIIDVIFKKINNVKRFMFKYE